MDGLSEALQSGRADEVKALIKQALDEGVTAKAILEEGMMAGMDVVGVRFRDGEIFVPEVLMAARAMNGGIELLRPRLVSENVRPVGTVVIGTVKGDLHDIGKNLVKMMMEGKGLTVVDLGTNVSADQFVTAACEHDADIVCCSALLTTTMVEMKTIIDAFVQAGARSRVKIMVGGAPVTQGYCDEIGADAYEADAASAAERALSFVSS
jgi:corrinoid protein of di/trimethylamine methyltransferase